MRQGSVRGDGTVPRQRGGRSADELGWDESLYEGGEDGEGGGGGDDDGPRSRHKEGDRPRPRRRRKRRALRWFAIVLAVLILGTAAAGYLWYEHLNGNIRTTPMPDGKRAAEATPNAAGQTPLNILLIGSDARDNAENQKLGGAKETFNGTALADVQMLLHLSADRSNMSVVSMPRDTLLQMPECTDPDNGKVYPATTDRMMTNASLGRGGPGCTVLAWEKLTNIHINHFMMVDFAGVVSMADAIGGVPVCVDANINSRNSKGEGSGLKLKKGTTYVQGEQALQWLRTRYGFEDGSDIGRAKAQHMYMNSMVRELRENATLTSPNKLRRLAEEATSALEVDEGLDTVKKLYDLSNELKRVPPQRITMTTMPYEYVGVRVQPKPGDADQLFRLVRDDVSLDGKDSPQKKKDRDKAREAKASDDPAAAPAETGVRVLNGTATSTTAATPGRASTVAALLQNKGYTRAAADQSSTPVQERTVIRFPSADLEGDAQALAKSLGLPLSSVEESKEVTGVTLVVGGDWRIGDVPPKPKPDEKDDKAPDTADALNGADSKACMRVNPNYTW
ncbi:LCP family protein [Streptomyces boluensis]|uniref:LytR family transcriptional regulator n=1 Tax=Streptomyces boluensis TaxID=1775135 RepID=A0A964XRE1_9ACTN|nr:LCP family protein [Streptomyces boluensis]NBE56797.1 LytR family transcriptional regulator [Streptomyces boluensis]